MWVALAVTASASFALGLLSRALLESVRAARAGRRGH
jgi:hypothetical protein